MSRRPLQNRPQIAVQGGEDFAPRVAGGENDPVDERAQLIRSFLLVLGVAQGVGQFLDLPGID
ncbi:hypothetical protein [Paracoccus aestuarii]|uniref:hypothetical protein n=1 Tax=Paracoccus aestuarii TaxID=453842 RepID=UPI002350FB2F|nr:hypothetical protein [Paracoccus aestuarii]